jgi:DNA adenine methylase
MNNVPKPILKYAGGKSKLVSTILDILPKKINAYYEPLCGGAAVFFALYRENRLKHRAILGDTNYDLVITYNAIRNKPSLVAKYLKEYANEHHYRLKEEGLEYAKEYYLRIRATPMEMLSDEGVAARMIYLNKTCFNGLYRVNKSGKFNVPFGSYKNPKIYDEQNLLAVAEALNQANIYKSDFEKLMRDAGSAKNSVCYIDPPYIPLSVTSNFTNYTSDGFGLDDQKRLVKCAKKLREKGVFVLLSNSDTDITRELYKDFYIKEVKVGRSINSKGDKRGKVGELLICGEKI